MDLTAVPTTDIEATGDDDSAADEIQNGDQNEACARIPEEDSDEEGADTVPPMAPWEDSEVHGMENSDIVSVQSNGQSSVTDKDIKAKSVSPSQSRVTRLVGSHEWQQEDRKLAAEDLARIRQTARRTGHGDGPSTEVKSPTVARIPNSDPDTTLEAITTIPVEVGEKQPGAYSVQPCGFEAAARRNRPSNVGATGEGRGNRRRSSRASFRESFTNTFRNLMGMSHDEPRPSMSNFIQVVAEPVDDSESHHMIEAERQKSMVLEQANQKLAQQVRELQEQSQRQIKSQRRKTKYISLSLVAIIIIAAVVGISIWAVRNGKNGIHVKVVVNETSLDGDSHDHVTNSTTLAMLPPTLQLVKERGYLRCGIDGSARFSVDMVSLD